jgi:hypothetical protein
METGKAIESGAAALVFASMFLFGRRIHVLAPLADPRCLISLGAGMSIAYVFVYLMPELHEARTALAESVSVALRYQGKATYYLALAGFLLFYGLSHFRVRSATTEGPARLAFRLDIGGFSAYVWVMSYLLVHNIEGGPVAIGLYAMAITFHFLALDHSLQDDHGARYARSGRLILAAMALLGWASAMLLPVPRTLLPLAVAFISGAIIMNSCIMELPTAKGGRFAWFVAGGAVYGLILLPLR